MSRRAVLIVETDDAPLEPELLRIIEALAEADAAEDYAAMMADQSPAPSPFQA